jgi:L-threonylcarbamoyladenylate synthase
MATRATRILPVHRLNRAPEDISITEWWASEKSKGSPEAAAVKEAAQYLRTSDVPVGFPTETVYGLGADATRSAAVQGIYKAKQRPSDNPLIIHVDSIDMITRLLNPQEANGATTSPTTESNTIPQIYQPLISRFWPGPLTILLRNPPCSLLAKEVTANLSTFGVRMPSSAFARLLIHVTDRPLAAPSANASTKPSPTTAQHVYHDLQGRIDLILDGGPCGVGVESTVVDGLSDPPAVLRPGGIGIEEIRSCPGWERVKVGYQDGALQANDVPRAPGMKYKHYSPRAEVVLFESTSNIASIARRIREDLNNTAIGARRVGIVRTRHWPEGLGLCSDQVSPPPALLHDNNTVSGLPLRSFEFAVTAGDSSSPSSHPTPKTVYDLRLGPDTEGIARGLFSALRTLDELGVDLIYIEGIPDDEGDLAAAVMNRLRKAAEVEVRV